QVQPMQLFVGAGAATCVGTMLLLAGMFMSWGVFLGLLGLTMAGGAIGGSWYATRRNWRQLDDCLAQADELRHDIADMQDKRKRIDQKLPAGGGPISVRLRDAQESLERLRQSPPRGGREG